MKCPKCQYLAFDQGDRCRNCGYEFALVVDDRELDLPIRTGDEPLGPFDDFSLGDVTPIDDRDRRPAGSAPGGRVSSPPRPPELPLFHGSPAGDAPLVSLPASPRAPISVRKSTVARSPDRREPDDEPMLDLGADSGDTSADGEPFNIPWSRADTPGKRDTAPVALAPTGARVIGGAIDLLLMAGIDFAILDRTLWLTELTFDNVDLIPKAPFLVFLALLNGGYLTAFTVAGGQTIGKMLAGTRVATSDEHGATDRVTLAQAALRSVGYFISLLPAGLGLLPALIGPDHRGFHDWLAHTRVVKA